MRDGAGEVSPVTERRSDDSFVRGTEVDERLGFGVSNFGESWLEGEGQEGRGEERVTGNRYLTHQQRRRRRKRQFWVGVIDGFGRVFRRGREGKTVGSFGRLFWEIFGGLRGC